MVVGASTRLQSHHVTLLCSLRVELENGVRRRAFERKFLSWLLFIVYLSPSKIRSAWCPIREASGLVSTREVWCVDCAPRPGLKLPEG